MAKRLDEFPGRSSYDWEKWLDGSPWLLRKGEDYQIDTASMRAAVSRAAKAQGKRVRTHAVRDADGAEGLAIQAHDEN